MNAIVLLPGKIAKAVFCTKVDVSMYFKLELWLKSSCKIHEANFEHYTVQS